MAMNHSSYAQAASLHGKINEKLQQGKQPTLPEGEVLNSAELVGDFVRVYYLGQDQHIHYKGIWPGTHEYYYLLSQVEEVSDGE